MSYRAATTYEEFREAALAFMAEHGQFPSRRYMTQLLGGGSTKLIYDRLQQLARELAALGQEHWTAEKRRGKAKPSI